MKRTTPWLLMMACMAGLAWLALAPQARGQPPKSDAANAGPQQKPAGRWVSKLEIGKPAPDFELPMLKSELNEKGEKVDRITDEKVKLSSFRGKKVVCLFMSSYT
jgi:hypothetical protein